MPTDLRAVIAACLELCRDRHPDVRIESRCAPDLPLAMLDAEQMRRALVNLLDNAVEAMAGRGQVEVEARKDADTGDLRLEVADDGPGIPREDRERPFLPYFSTKKRGTGLGLAIVHRIVSDHGGRIRVEDNRPRGARFVIDLPAARA